ncbi:MAG: hypothetical protein II992_00370 [Lachnospiraceae bacterium]|nr:hypothetical protein [Lachnospiraceae bacterium]
MRGGNGERPNRGDFKDGNFPDKEAFKDGEFPDGNFPGKDTLPNGELPDRGNVNGNLPDKDTFDDKDNSQAQDGRNFVRQ